MADFKRLEAITPVSIPRLTIRLTREDDPDPIMGSGPYQAAFELIVTMSDGSPKIIQGDLVPYITTEERNALINFIETLQTRAEAQIL